MICLVAIHCISTVKKKILFRIKYNIKTSQKPSYSLSLFDPSRGSLLHEPVNKFWGAKNSSIWLLLSLFDDFHIRHTKFMNNINVTTQISLNRDSAVSNQLIHHNTLWGQGVALTCGQLYGQKRLR